MLANPFEQQIRVGDTLAAVGDLAIALRSKKIDALGDIGAPRPGLHIEGFGYRRIPVDEDRLVEQLGELRLMRRAKIVPPFDFEQLLELGIIRLGANLGRFRWRIIIGDAREARWRDPFQARRDPDSGEANSVRQSRRVRCTMWEMNCSSISIN